MSAGSDDDDATRSCFFKFDSVSLEWKRLFARVSFEKTCSKWYVVPNRDANFRACLARMGKASA